VPLGVTNPHHPSKSSFGSVRWKLAEASTAGCYSPLPDIEVFRYPRYPQVSLDDPKRADIEAQWKALKGFFERWFKTARRTVRRWLPVL
jgi:hypothetical protein